MIYIISLLGFFGADFANIADDGGGEHDSFKEDANNGENDAIVKHPTESNKDAEKFVDFGGFLPDGDLVEDSGSNGEEAERAIESENCDDSDGEEDNREENAVAKGGLVFLFAVNVDVEIVKVGEEDNDRHAHTEVGAEENIRDDAGEHGEDVENNNKTAALRKIGGAE